MRRTVRGGVRLKGLSQSGHWPSGNPRFYLRRPGEKPMPMPDAPKDSPKFIKAWSDAMEGKAVLSPRRKPASGTIGAGVLAYLASDHFLALAPNTRGARRSLLDAIYAKYGRGLMADLEPRHIRQDLAPLDPHPANNRLKVWRALGRYWVDAGLIDSDPARDVRKRVAPASEGHTPWLWSDAAMFRARWPVGTMQRLAFELLIHTGAARVDVVRLGPGHVADGWLSYRRRKSKSLAVVPWTTTAPPWFPASPYVHDCVAQAPRHLTFLSTAKGAARSEKAFGGWFSRAVEAAGIDAGKTAHGVRKLLSVTMAERGATEEQRMAILGHETSSEARHYSQTADARKIICGTDFSNFATKLEKSGKNTL